MKTQRFPILLTGLNRAIGVLGLSPSRSWVDVRDDTLSVRMSRAFRLDVPIVNVRDARPDTGRVWGWGVHGWQGRWLVNGSSSGLVRIGLNPRHAPTWARSRSPSASSASPSTIPTGSSRR